MTGVYFRVTRDGTLQNIEVEYLTDEEREQICNQMSRDEIMKLVHVVCNTLEEIYWSSPKLEE